MQRSENTWAAPAESRQTTSGSPSSSAGTGVPDTSSEYATGCQRERSAGWFPRADGDSVCVNSDCGFGARHEAELRDFVELTNVSRQLQEREQARPLARAEAVAELLEVPGEEASGIAVALARLVGELLGLSARGADRFDQRVLELAEARADRLGAGPDGEHHRQAGAL